MELSLERLIAIIEAEADDDEYVITDPGGHVAAWIDSHRFAVRCAERIAAAEHGSFRLTGDRGNTERPKGGT
jgi:hypothetical protein